MIVLDVEKMVEEAIEEEKEEKEGVVVVVIVAVVTVDLVEVVRGIEGEEHRDQGLHLDHRVKRKGTVKEMKVIHFQIIMHQV